MIKPQSDRLDYSQLLAPPSAYVTVFAVGTTYSLDLGTLVGVCIALGLSENIDSKLKDNPLYLLEAMRKTADKLLIFCEGGQIKAPNVSNYLHILLEKMVVEITLENRKAFHPKFWLIKYENASKEALYRCLILSRNLSDDRSWDVAACLEGRPAQELQTHKTGPLSDFLRALRKLAKQKAISPAKMNAMSQIAHEISKIEFQLESKVFTDFEFCPVGIAGYKIDKSGFFSSFHEMLIISPFLSKDTIGLLNRQALTNPRPNTLITRQSELTKLDAESVTRFNVYTMKDMIINGEEVLSEGDTEGWQQQDIHAKLYLKTKSADSELYLGSLNATTSACGGNIEFMLKLYGKRRRLNVANLENDLFGDDEKKNPFELVPICKIIDQPPLEESINLDKIIKDICRLQSSAIVLPCEDKFGVELSFPEFNCEHKVTISPMQRPRYEQEMAELIRFENLDLLHLSEFYIVSVSAEDHQLRRVIKIHTEHMPEHRETTIANSIIRNKQDFIQYINFILGDDYLIASLENSGFDGKFAFGFGEPITALYEKMLKAVVHSPAKLEEINQILRLIIDNDKIPAGFVELCDLFNKVVGQGAK